MSIEQLIIEAQHRHIAATGKEPSRVYLGLDEAAEFKAVTNEIIKRYGAHPAYEQLGKPPVYRNMTVYFVIEKSHLFVA